MNGEMLKGKNGITLVALVITMVIIIILATITIKTVFDDNGIVPYAEKAKIETETSADKEALQMLYAELYLKRTWC